MSNNGSVDAITQWVPYVLDVSETRFWVHYGLVIAGFLLAVITYLSQRKEPAPYGKHAASIPRDGWGPMIPQRLGHMASDGICCVLFFSVIFAVYGQHHAYTGYVFLVLWLAHYIQRGFVHPFLMHYSRTHVQLGIVAGTVAPNLLYSFINADWISSAVYDNYYYRDPRLWLGLVIFGIGYFINRWADWRIRTLRGRSRVIGFFTEQQKIGYLMPEGGLFEYISCPNYFGEALEWFGWAMATWSLAGLVWLLFCLATFVPRAMHNHLWYKQVYENYPAKRKALIPFVY